MLFALSTPWAAADWAAGGHDARRAGVLEPPRDDRVVARIDEHLKPIGDEFFGRFDRGDGIGQEGFLVSEDFELDQSAPGFSRFFKISRPSARRAPRRQH